MTAYYFLLIFLVLLSPAVSWAQATPYFSPQGEIKKQLLQGIQESKASIEIAAFQFTSGDLAEALLLAKKRGVRVRLLLDQREAQKDTSLAPFLREQGLEVKSIQGRLGGQMHHMFIIFDSRKVFTGSYSLTEHSEKFNYENALLLEELPLVAKYKAHFSKLFGEPYPEVSITKEPRYFIGLSPYQIHQRLSDTSLSPSERDVFWSHCQDMYVRGEAEVVTLFPDLSRLTLKDEGIAIELALETPPPPLQEGQRVSYTGKLTRRPSTDKTFMLDRGTIHQD
jgi:phosphatidylserine/phosphatidylglycerophosphate/cardiolipin synthase-like enzyme